MSEYERERLARAREFICIAKSIATGEPSYTVLIAIQNTLADALRELAGVAA